MANVIKVVFPQAHHRFCLWHIIHNVIENGGDKFGCSFIKRVNKYRTQFDFEKGWEELISHHGVKDKN